MLIILNIVLDWVSHSDYKPAVKGLGNDRTFSVSLLVCSFLTVKKESDEILKHVRYLSPTDLQLSVCVYLL